MAHAASLTELWTLSHGKDAAQCLVAAHPLGVELRYLMNQRPLITRVFQTWDDVTHQAGLWREGLESRGWTLEAQTQVRRLPRDRWSAEVVPFRASW